MKIKKARGLKVVGLLVSVLLAACGSGSDVAYDLGSGVGGTGLTNVFESPAEMGVGDIMPIELSASGDFVVDFEGVDASSRFILLLGNAREGGVGSDIQLSTDLAAPINESTKALLNEDLLDEYEMSSDEILSTWMRVLEYDFALNEPEPVSMNLSKSLYLDESVDLNDGREFRMLNSLSSSTSYVTVKGYARCITENVIFYVDSRTTNELSEDEIEDLCYSFSDDIAEEEVLYGSLSDVDSNDKIIVFATMQVNMLGSMGGGIITGYFYAGDLYPRSASNPVSNDGEIIYTMVPDPSGKWGVPVDNDFALNNLIPAVLVHEAQHAISYNQHVFVNGGAPEEPWLNEGLSHFTEDIMGYGRENPSRVAMYLDNTSIAGLVTSSTPNLLERGAAYLFMRYLYEQHPDGDSFLRALQNTSFTGVENLERAFDGEEGFKTFKQFMARWAIALAMTDRGLTADERYIYEQRTIDPVTGNYVGVCLNCNAEDGRGTILEGVQLAPYYGYHTVSLDSSSLKYFKLETVPDEIVIEGNTDGSDFGVLIRSE